jgi:hypothetical protein
MDWITYILGTIYSSFSPATNLAAATCFFNDRVVPCERFFSGNGSSAVLPPEFFAILGLLWIFFLILGFAVLILVIASMWKIYEKAGQPGWASLIPIYNIVVLLHIVKRPTWWVILYFIPIVNIVINLIVIYELAKAFGKDIGFTFGLIFLSFIFYPILAFGNSSYQGEKPPAMSL